MKKREGWKLKHCSYGLNTQLISFKSLIEDKVSIFNNHFNIFALNKIYPERHLP